MPLIVIALLAISGLASEGFTAAEIMQRVAENQDKAQKDRAVFVYDQTVHRTLRRKGGKLLREEFWTFTVIPGPRETKKS